MINQPFLIASMPPSRPADYCLGYMDGCVFLDFNNYDNDRVCLIRVSFDGYGCCSLAEHAIPLNENDSSAFKAIVRENMAEQSALLTIVKRAIALNEKMIWPEALKEYNLL